MRSRPAQIREKLTPGAGPVLQRANLSLRTEHARRTREHSPRAAPAEISSGSVDFRQSRSRRFPLVLLHAFGLQSGSGGGGSSSGSSGSIGGGEGGEQTPASAPQASQPKHRPILKSSSFSELGEIRQSAITTVVYKSSLEYGD